MKKVLFWAAFGLLTAVVSFSSCGKDDDDEPKNHKEQTDDEDEKPEADDPSKIYPGIYYYQDNDYTNSYWFKGDSLIINSFDRTTGVRAPINLRGKFRIDGDSLRLSLNDDLIKLAFGFKRVSKNELRISGDINATLKRNEYFKEGKEVLGGPFRKKGETYEGDVKFRYFFGKNKWGQVAVLDAKDEKYYPFSVEGNVLSITKDDNTQDLLVRQTDKNTYQIGSDSYETFGHQFGKTGWYECEYKTSEWYYDMVTHGNKLHDVTYVYKLNFEEVSWTLWYYKIKDGSTEEWDSYNYYIDEDRIYMNTGTPQYASIKSKYFSVVNSDSTIVKFGEFPMTLQ